LAIPCNDGKKSIDTGGKMSKFIPVQTPGGAIWVEVEDNTAIEKLELTGISEKAQRDFEDAVNALKKNAELALTKMLELSPNEVEISFVIKVGAEAGTPFFALAKASSEASFTVVTKWKSEKKEK
jgi:hypothetical protein